MDAFPGLVLCLLVILNLTKPASLCQGRDKPLHLTPYLDRNEIDKARKLSEVDRSCVDDFVPDSFAGLMTTNKVLGNHLFFWFFPSTQNGNAPLLLWLNGGPTVSSMIGLFWEHGPMSIEDGEETESGYTKRKHSWAGPFSMLYVDNPVGVGFSYSDNHDKVYNVTQKGYTNDMVSFMAQFFVLFPEYKSKNFYLGGQSYAGKYVSALAYHIHNEIRKGSSDINLTGIYLGAPFYDPESQSAAHYDYLYALGVISHKQLQDAEKEAINLFAHAKKKTPDLVTSNLTQFIFRFGGFGSLDNYVSRQRVNYEDVANLLELSKLKSAANVGDLTFVESDHKLYEVFGPDWIVSTKFEMTELLNNYKVLIYNGDYDVVVNSPMIEAALLSTPWMYQEQYRDASRQPWHRGDEVIGFFSLTGRLCRVVIHGAGHQVPHDTPEAALLMMQQFVESGCLSHVHSAALYTESSSLSASHYVYKHSFLSSFVFSAALSVYVFFY